MFKKQYRQFKEKRIFAYLYSGCKVTSFLSQAAVVKSSPEARFCINFKYLWIVQCVSASTFMLAKYEFTSGTRPGKMPF